jgi:cytochrome c peroxidase
MKTLKLILNILFLLFPLTASSGDFEDLKEFYDPLPKMKHPSDNPWSKEKENLGKMLYFDPRLSSSNWISCATCHNPGLGWGDGLPRPLGHGQKELDRHSPTIINSGYFESQFWDGRAKSLEKQAVGPIGSQVEMKQDLKELVKELNNIPGYVRLFKKVFPKEEIKEVTNGRL